VVVVGGFAITAKPSFAQSPKGPADVHVVNAATDPVPVSMTGTHSVNVANTPNVNISNTPNVNVSSLPAVQIGNAPANSIPVTVQNFPVSQQAPQPITFNQLLSVPANQFFGNFQTVYTVPAGKRLIIDFVSFLAFPQQGENCYLSVASGDPTTGQGLPPGGWFGAEATLANRQTCSEMCDMVYDAGTEVHLTVNRDKNLTVETLMNARLCGRLYDVP